MRRNRYAASDGESNGKIRTRKLPQSAKLATLMTSG